MTIICKCKSSINSFSHQILTRILLSSQFLSLYDIESQSVCTVNVLAFKDELEYLSFWSLLQSVL